jgi:signal transduction histidine kinase
VQDTGVGIPREKITRLFEEFYRVEDILQRKTEEGTGIGLSLTKRLIEVQGGNISVESEEGVGSAFTFCLPIGC